MRPAIGHRAYLAGTNGLGEGGRLLPRYRADSLRRPHSVTSDALRADLALLARSSRRIVSLVLVGDLEAHVLLMVFYQVLDNIFALRDQSVLLPLLLHPVARL